MWWKQCRCWTARWTEMEVNDTNWPHEAVSLCKEAMSDFCAACTPKCAIMKNNESAAGTPYSCRQIKASIDIQLLLHHSLATECKILWHKAKVSQSAIRDTKQSNTENQRRKIWLYALPIVIAKAKTGAAKKSSRKQIWEKSTPW